MSNEIIQKMGVSYEIPDVHETSALLVNDSKPPEYSIVRKFDSETRNWDFAFSFNG